MFAAALIAEAMTPVKRKNFEHRASQLEKRLLKDAPWAGKVPDGPTETSNDEDKWLPDRDWVHVQKDGSCTCTGTDGEPPVSAGPTEVVTGEESEEAPSIDWQRVEQQSRVTKFLSWALSF